MFGSKTVVTLVFFQIQCLRHRMLSMLYSVLSSFSYVSLSLANLLVFKLSTVRHVLVALSRKGGYFQLWGWNSYLILILSAIPQRSHMGLHIRCHHLPLSQSNPSPIQPYPPPRTLRRQPLRPSLMGQPLQPRRNRLYNPRIHTYCVNRRRIRDRRRTIQSIYDKTLEQFILLTRTGHDLGAFQFFFILGLEDLIHRLFSF